MYTYIYCIICSAVHIDDEYVCVCVCACACACAGLPARGRGFGRPVPRGDHFRSRPPNTSRPPSLHVDDFVALEKRGEHPTGPTGYNGGPRVPARGRVSTISHQRSGQRHGSTGRAVPHRLQRRHSAELCGDIHELQWDSPTRRLGSWRRRQRRLIRESLISLQRDQRLNPKSLLKDYVVNWTAQITNLISVLI